MASKLLEVYPVQWGWQTPQFTFLLLLDSMDRSRGLVFQLVYCVSELQAPSPHQPQPSHDTPGQCSLQPPPACQDDPGAKHPGMLQAHPVLAPRALPVQSAPRPPSSCLLQIQPPCQGASCMNHPVNHKWDLPLFQLSHPGTPCMDHFGIPWSALHLGSSCCVKALPAQSTLGCSALAHPLQLQLSFQSEPRSLT